MNKFSDETQRYALAARLSRGEVLKGKDAARAADLGLGKLTRTLYGELILHAGKSTSAVVRREMKMTS